MRQWRLRVFDLDADRVAELRYFCRQYDAKRARLAAIRGGVNGRRLDGMPGARGRVGDPTAAAAIRAAESKEARDVAMIEAAAELAAEGSRAVYRALINNVTRGVPVSHLILPMGRNQFYALRRRFYWTLDRLQKDGDTGAVEL